MGAERNALPAQLTRHAKDPGAAQRQMLCARRKPGYTRSRFRLIDKTTVFAPTRALVISLAFRLALGAACADDASLGGFICARPFVPHCADQLATYQNAQNVSACQRELDQYAVATTAYRDCLERQIASAMRQANDVLDRFRCLSRRDCPLAAKQK